MKITLIAIVITLILIQAAVRNSKASSAARTFNGAVWLRLYSYLFALAALVFTYLIFK